MPGRAGKKWRGKIFFFTPDQDFIKKSSLFYARPGFYQKNIFSAKPGFYQKKKIILFCARPGFYQKKIIFFAPNRDFIKKKSSFFAPDRDCIKKIILFCGPCRPGRAGPKKNVPGRAKKLRAGRAVPCRGHPVKSEPIVFGSAAQPFNRQQAGRPTGPWPNLLNFGFASSGGVLPPSHESHVSPPRFIEGNNFLCFFV